MVMEKVKEIKRAEDKADAIIRDAQEKAEGIKASLEAQINNLRDEKEKELAAGIKKHKEISDKRTEDRITVLKQEYLHKSACIRERAERKIEGVAESIWKELKSKLSMP